jgi:hypothetical protein
MSSKYADGILKFTVIHVLEEVFGVFVSSLTFKTYSLFILAQFHNRKMLCNVKCLKIRQAELAFFVAGRIL